MHVPKHLWRYPTAEAIRKLARRFALPNHPAMQDWAWEVADPNRIPEFVRAYLSGELDEDEQFTLMEVIIQSFEDLETPLESHPDWLTMLRILDENIELHAHTVYYWSLSVDEIGHWRVTEHLRAILKKYQSRLGQP